VIPTIKRWLSINEYQLLIKNYSSLGLVQLSNYILPLITLPYLTRVLGVKHFGLVMMAQAIMIYLTLITDYGFNLSATKEIAKNQHNPTMVSRIFSSVLIIKCSLLVVSFVILSGLIALIPTFNEHATLFYLSFLIVIGNTFLPTFLFQGLEKMTFIALFNLIAKISFTGLIFIVIQSVNDYYLVHALWGISYIIVNIASFYVIIKKLNIVLCMPSWQQIKQYYQLSFEYFLSRIAIAIYLNANIILIGLILTAKTAGYYSGAEKLLFAITTFYAPLIETIYPYISRSKNIRFAKKILILATSINTIGCIAAFFIAPIAIPLIFGSDFASSVIIFQWMLIIAFIHLPVSIIGYPILGALGYEKTANRSGIIGALIHIGLIGIFYNQLTQPIHFVWIMIGSQSSIFLLRSIKLMQLIKKGT
jgi:PST family polysaccharide transporter